VERLKGAADELLRTWIDGETCFELADRTRRTACPEGQ
jgi:hypothetical protein